MSQTQLPCCVRESAQSWRELLIDIKARGLAVCPNQTLETVMRCHIAAFDAMGGACAEVLYDRMKTAVIGEDAAGVVTYNASLVALLRHYGSAPRACQPYRAKTKGKVERP